MHSNPKISNPNENIVELDPQVASAFGLVAGQKVTLNIDAQPFEAHTIHLEPATASDWEIVEIHAQFLEARLINQVRAVSLNQPILVFPSNSAIATLQVTQIIPTPPTTDPKKPLYAKVSPNCEVIVAPKTRKKKSGSVTSSRSKRSNSGKKKTQPKEHVVLRGYPNPYQFATEGYEFEVFVDFDAVMHPLKGAQYVTVSVIVPNLLRDENSSSGPTDSPGNQQTSNSPTISKDKNAPAQQPIALLPSTKVVAKLVHFPDGPAGTVALSRTVSSALNIQQSVGNIILLEAATNPLSNIPDTLIIHPYIIDTPAKSLGSQLKLGKNEESQESKKITETKQRALTRIQEKLLNGVITNREQLIAIDDIFKYGGLVEFKKSDGWFISPNIPNYKIEFGDDILRPVSKIPKTIESIENELTPKRKLVGLDNTLNKILKTLRKGKVGAVILGPSGSGKSSVLDSIINTLQRKDLIHCIKISCSEILQDQAVVIKDKINNWFKSASWYSPSILIFDDLDKLIPAEQQNTDSTQTRQLAEYFHLIASSTIRFRNITILASAASKESLHPLLVSTHTFEESFQLKSPGKDIRKLVLVEAMNSMGMKPDPSFDLLEIAGSATEGYLPSDLWTLVERANHEAVLRDLDIESDSDSEFDQEEEIEQDSQNENEDFLEVLQVDFTSALEGFVPSSLRGVKLQKADVSWTDIGGLGEVKSVLLETLEWPTKYAPIFANCSLRLRSGILLYGYPGCGKTLLASAVAAQCGLNFISIKGPEILNKYIGASEQSVRELFERAQAAKPCILFFDEFDSIAPKRGHDSTGVTDRVVNQMLTQMDGAEGLDGVYVLAATSRPDLIDSALLRPGRLDKSVICDMPNTEDRFDILQAVTSKMNMDPTVDIHEVAENCEGFSGADLQALAYNAYLSAVHDKLDRDAEEEIKNAEAVASGNAEQQSDNKQLEFFQVDISSEYNQYLEKQSTTQKTEQQITVEIRERAQILKKLENLVEPKTSSGNSQSENVDSQRNQVLITQKHFMSSLKETKPSISLKEKLKLQRIYQEFVSGRSGDMPNGEASGDIGGRTTLM